MIIQNRVDITVNEPSFYRISIFLIQEIATIVFIQIEKAQVKAAPKIWSLWNLKSESDALKGLLKCTFYQSLAKFKILSKYKTKIASKTWSLYNLRAKPIDSISVYSQTIFCIYILRSFMSFSVIFVGIPRFEIKWLRHAKKTSIVGSIRAIMTV